MIMMSLTCEDLTAQINESIDQYIDILLSDEVITKLQADKMRPYRAVVYPSGFWGKLISKIMKNVPDQTYRTIVKIPKLEVHNET